MRDIDFLSLDDVLLAHLDQTSRYGGDPGVRDFGLLESAIAQPRATLHMHSDRGKPRSPVRQA